MGLIGGALLTICGLLAAILVSVATRLVADDVKEWLPWIRKRLIEQAVRRLPESERERYAEEWPSFVNETPGGDLSKIVAALWLSFAANKINSEVSLPLSYQLRYRVTGATTWIPFGLPSAGPSMMITGLSASTSYEFDVIAINNIGSTIPTPFSVRDMGGLFEIRPISRPVCITKAEVE